MEQTYTNLSYQQVVVQCQEYYPELKHLNGLALLLEVEARLCILTMMDGLTEYERTKCSMLNEISKYLS